MESANSPAPFPFDKDSSEVSEKHILVTGGAGFIGSHASLRLLEMGHRVTVVDNLTRGSVTAVDALQLAAEEGKFRFVKADLGDRGAVDILFEEGRFEAVMHFAAKASVAESVGDPLMYYRENSFNTLNLLEAMKAHKVQKLIFSSTCAVYGNPLNTPVTEDTPTVPINPYGKSKLMAEEIIRDFVSANPKYGAIILRYFNVIGSDPLCRLGENLPRGKLPAGRISAACLHVALGHVPAVKILGTCHVTPDGTCVRDYVHVSDLVEAHIGAMEGEGGVEGGKCEVYNVGTGKGTSVREFVDAFKEVYGKPFKVEEEREGRLGDADAIWCDPKKIKNKLFWEPKYPNCKDALTHAWNWHLKNSQ